MAQSVIISCAITGSLHVPSMSPHLPITPDEIASESIAAAEAGAAICMRAIQRQDVRQPAPMCSRRFCRKSSRRRLQS
jgi:uncharacterized protein (DUF849 family)